MVSLLLSPVPVLFQVAVTVSPILKAPPVPLAPLSEIFASVTVGATLSTETFEVSAVVVLPLAEVAVTDTLRLVASTAPATMVYEAVQVPEEFVAATADPPPNSLKSMVTPVMSLLLSPLAVLSQVAVTVSPILYVPPLPDGDEVITILASVTFGPGATVAGEKSSVSSAIMAL